MKSIALNSLTAMRLEKFTGKNMAKKFGSFLLLIMAVLLSGIAGMLCLGGINSYARDNLDDASGCVFIIPPDYVPSDESGVFKNKSYPMESSSISYSVYYNGKDKVMTNREAAEYKASGRADIVDESLNLTKEIYESNMIAAYNKEYSENVDFSVNSFDKITVDGYPGFKIVSEYKPSDMEKIHQTVYMIISKYRTFTISFQRADDDDCQEIFERSAATIHVK